VSAIVLAGTDAALLARFARAMQRRYGAELYLFGSRARGTARPGSDYDVVAVSDAFAGVPVLRRCLDRGELFTRAGGRGIPLDLHCLTRAEFAEERLGYGFVGTAERLGELHRIAPSQDDLPAEAS
jgi:hypothetical protein